MNPSLLTSGVRGLCPLAECGGSSGRTAWRCSRLGSGDVPAVHCTSGPAEVGGHPVYARTQPAREHDLSCGGGRGMNRVNLRSSEARAKTWSR